MPKYLQVAEEANTVAKQLLSLVPEDQRPQAAELIARFFNFGVRVSPRSVHHTVRLRAVRMACEELPVRVSMQERKDERTGKTYNVLVTQQLIGDWHISDPAVETTPTNGPVTVESGFNDEASE